MEPTEQLAVILPTLGDLVDGLDPATLHNPTPCDDFDLRGVLDHIIVLGGSLAHLFRGEAPPQSEPPEDDGRVPAEQVRRVLADLQEAAGSEGAADRMIVAPAGTMPGATFARFLAFDALVHGWDIARSSGSRFELPDEVVAEVDDFARSTISDEMRDGQTFKAPTVPPSGASPIERVAAFSGRTV